MGSQAKNAVVSVLLIAALLVIWDHVGHLFRPFVEAAQVGTATHIDKDGGVWTIRRLPD